MFIKASNHRTFSTPHRSAQKAQVEKPSLQNQEGRASDVGQGYDEDFLDIRLDLPEVDADYKDQVAPLKSDPTKSELKYTHFSVVMNKMRRTPIFTAVNIDGAQYNPKKRKGDWDFDPRINSQHQMGNRAYSSCLLYTSPSPRD